MPTTRPRTDKGAYNFYFELFATSTHAPSNTRRGTALHNAVQSSSVECVEILLKKEEDVYYAKSGTPRTLVLETSTPSREKSRDKAPPATNPKEKRLVAIVVLEGSNTLDYNGYSPLHVAAGVGSVECAKLLIQRGSRIDEKNKSGRTPLFYAILNGHEVTYCPPPSLTLYLLSSN
mgnify:CR=1 FL=1